MRRRADGVKDDIAVARIAIVLMRVPVHGAGVNLNIAGHFSAIFSLQHGISEVRTHRAAWHSRIKYPIATTVRRVDADAAAVRAQPRIVQIKLWYTVSHSSESLSHQNRYLRTLSLITNR